MLPFEILFGCQYVKVVFTKYFSITTVTITTVTITTVTITTITITKSETFFRRKIVSQKNVNKKILLDKFHLTNFTQKMSLKKCHSKNVTRKISLNKFHSKNFI